MEMHVTGVLRLQSSIITKMDVGNKRCVLERLANTICPVPCCHYCSFSKPLSQSHRVVMTVKPTVALILIVTHAGACHPLCYTTASLMICTSKTAFITAQPLCQPAKETSLCNAAHHALAFRSSSCDALFQHRIPLMIPVFECLNWFVIKTLKLLYIDVSIK